MHNLVIMGPELSLFYLKANFSMQKKQQICIHFGGIMPVYTPYSISLNEICAITKTAVQAAEMPLQKVNHMKPAWPPLNPEKH